MRKSHASAKPNPPPAATPFRAATTGLGISRIMAIAECRTGIIFSRAGTIFRSANFSTKNLMSPPPLNARPLPVSTMARTSASSQHSMSARRNPADSSLFMALNWSGRLSVIVATLPSRPNTTASSMMRSSFLLTLSLCADGAVSCRHIRFCLPCVTLRRNDSIADPGATTEGRTPNRGNRTTHSDRGVRRPE